MMHSFSLCCALQKKDYILISLYLNTEFWSLSSDYLSGYNVHKSPSIFNLGLIFLTRIFFNFDSLVLDWESWFSQDESHLSP